MVPYVEQGGLGEGIIGEGLGAQGNGGSHTYNFRIFATRASCLSSHASSRLHECCSYTICPEPFGHSLGQTHCTMDANDEDSSLPLPDLLAARRQPFEIETAELPDLLAVVRGQHDNDPIALLPCVPCERKREYITTYVEGRRVRSKKGAPMTRGECLARARARKAELRMSSLGKSVCETVSNHMDVIAAKTRVRTKFTHMRIGRRGSVRLARKMVAKIRRGLDRGKMKPHMSAASIVSVAFSSEDQYLTY